MAQICCLKPYTPKVANIMWPLYIILLVVLHVRHGVKESLGLGVKQRTMLNTNVRMQFVRLTRL